MADMIRVGITGIDGLIGWHLRVYLHAQPDVEVTGADRTTFSSDEKLRDFVSGCDAIVHLAGMNRGDDAEIESTNIRLVEQLIAACTTAGKSPHLLFSSSTHATGQSPYGRSKRHCSELLQRWAEQSGAVFTNLILPHIYGEGGKPFYNSVVSTFCYQLANGEVPEIKQDGELSLLHAQDLSAMLWQLLQTPKSGDQRLQGSAMKVSELLARLQKIAGDYREHILPDMSETTDFRLFNTYRSYLFPTHYPVTLKMHEDARGALTEVVKTRHGGQCFFSTTKAGITRGNHYHTGKVERFLVVKGRATIRLRRMFSSQIHTFDVDGGLPQYIDIPTCYTHNITNTGDEELVTIFWSHEIFDPAHPDTFMEVV
ncbi:capsular polysaccharide synthesis enzyme CapF [Mariprofundus ferrooxydans PV-1]|uniref:Capsular polysaccharide synthesis enzyme CapF n=2 Tax=Mariprofundus ferrooxydans TaxID=314344 RepID=Q0EZA0_9PROT|nr:capsular polysaccharide synthesis enzyme CapF [Mariprofundus ferrooxydans PV-1]